jgi:hypothetical protein
MVVHFCNPNTLEAEIRRSWLPGQTGLHTKTVSKTKENKTDCEGHADVQKCNHPFNKKQVAFKIIILF